jgi:DNA-binding NtrC family response regulator
MMERAVALAQPGEIMPERFLTGSLSDQGTLKELVERYTKGIILERFLRFERDLQKTAQSLGITQTALREKLKSWGII